MRLSEIKGERVFDVIADIIDPIANIAEDPEASALFRREKLPEGQDPKQFALARLRKSVPPLLRGHKADLIAILAAIEGTSPEEYAEALDLAKLTRESVELITDRVFIELFISARSGTPSGSAPESTEGLEA